MTFGLQFTQEALDDLDRIDSSARRQIAKAIAGRLENPHVPAGALNGSLSGAYKIKLRKLGIRVIYIVEDQVCTVIVIAIGKRDKDVAYRKAHKRFTRLTN